MTTRNTPSQESLENMKPVPVMLAVLVQGFSFGHYHHSAKKTKKKTPTHVSLMCAYTGERTCTCVCVSQSQMHKITHSHNAVRNNTLPVLTAHGLWLSQASAHTISKSLCHLSTFNQGRLKGDSHAPLLPPSVRLPPVPLSLSFHLLCVFVLDDQAVGWSV